jgi:hypothetical protein
VDWPCEVKTLFRDNNLGCKLGVSGGIDWFFENEEEGIILEDDVMPISSFFPYCDELLERYRHVDSVGTISGCNLLSNRFTPESSYMFSRYCRIWGWASWRRAWRNYDVEMKSWPEWRDQGGLIKICPNNRLVQAYFKNCFNDTYLGKIDTWDYQLAFACFRFGLFTILPHRNQVRNLGFGVGTHTKADTPIPSYIFETDPQLLDFPLVHPATVEREKTSDTLIDQVMHRVTYMDIFKSEIRDVPVLGSFLGKVWSLIKN